MEYQEMMQQATKLGDDIQTQVFALLGAGMDPLLLLSVLDNAKNQVILSTVTGE